MASKRLKFAVEEYLTELTTDQVIEDVQKVEENDPKAKKAVDNIADVEEEAQEAREETTDEDTDPDATPETTEDPSTAEPVDADNPDADAASEPVDGGTPEGGDPAAQASDDAVKPAAESIYFRW